MSEATVSKGPRVTSGGDFTDPLIEGASLRPVQILTIAICTFVALVDGFDNQAIAFAAPVIARSWGLPATSFAPIFVAGLLGGLAGAILFGRLADGFGRKPALCLSLLLVAAGSAGTLFAESPAALMAIRAMTGLGLGGALPCAIALTTEYSPTRLRASITTAMFCAYPFGAVVGAIVTAPLLARGNWHAVFWLGTASPLVALPLVWTIMPESLGWLRRAGRYDDLARISARLGARLPEVATSAAAPAIPKAALSEIVADGRSGATAILATAFLVGLLLVYLLVTWLPSFAVAEGVGGGGGAGATAILNLAGIVGGLLIAWIGDRTSIWRTTAAAYVLSALTAAGLALAGSSHVLALSATAGLFCVGPQMCLVSLAAALYPPQVRASAIGVMMAAGRVGAIFGPLLGGLLLGRASAFPHLAAVVAIGSAIAAVALFAGKARGATAPRS